MVSIQELKSCVVAAGLFAICAPATALAEETDSPTAETAPVAAASKSQKPWQFEFQPYFFAPSIDGSTSLGRVGGDVSVDPGTIFENLEAAFLARFEATHESGYGFYVDYSMMNLGSGASSPLGDVDVDIDQAVLDVAATYRVERSEDIFDFYAGIRRWKLEHDTTFTSGILTGTNLNRKETWVDPMVGVKWQRQLSDEWRVIAMADIGGFGVASDFAWQAALGGAYDGWENTSIVFMYRATGVDYETGTSGTSSYFKYDTVTSGPLVGVSFRF